MSLAGERLISIKIHCSHKKPTEVTVDFFTRGSNFFANFCLAVVSLPTCADNLCKQSGPRSGLTKCQALSGSKLLDILKELLENLDLEKNQPMTKKHEKVLRRKKVNCQVGYNTVPSGETISGLIHHTNPEF